MNKKIIMSLILGLIMSFTLVSAGIISNEVFSFNKETNEATLTYDYTVDEECLFDKPMVILDSKNNVVGRTGGGVPICQICFYGSCSWIRPPKTGTFEIEVTVPIVSKKEIESIDELSYTTDYDDWYATVGLPDIKVRYAVMSLFKLNNELEKIDKEVAKLDKKIDKLYEEFHSGIDFDEMDELFEKISKLEVKTRELRQSKRNIEFYIGLN